MMPAYKKIYLCRPNQKKLTVLNGVDPSSVSCSLNIKDYDTLRFEVDRYISVDGKEVESNGYKELKAHMQLYLEDIGHFTIQEPTIENDGYQEKKTISAESLEKQFEYTDYVGFEVNTGEIGSLERIAANNIDDLGFIREFVTFYNPENHELSLLHLVLAKMPGWSVSDENIDKLLWDTKLSISENSINLYALLTSVIAPKAECIFMFDTIHKQIKAYSKHSLELETNIFIGLRNLANSVEVSCDDDSIFTRFNVQGDGDLQIENVNYGDPRIFDLSYFMNTDYMNPELIDKVKAWIKFREDNREEYIDLGRQLAKINDRISKINLRQPSDENYYKQWDEMEEELLHKNLKYYHNIITTLQLSVDENPAYETDDEGNEIYQPWRNSDGTINHAKYKEKLYEEENGYGGYYTYLEVLDYVIPNIEIAIENLPVIPEKKTDYIKAYETNWELYGISELEAKRKDYENRITAIKEYSRPWSELSETEKISYSNKEQNYEDNSTRKQYHEYKGYIGDENTPNTILYKLKELKAEVAALSEEKKVISDKRESFVAAAKMEHPQFNFTAEDIVILNELFFDTDYTNRNILTTSTDTTLNTIDVQKELYDDAVSKLSEVSQPQYSFTTDMDNLLRLPEFESWVPDFALLHYIRLGIRDDYSVKLRLVEISYNPCDVTPDLKVVFSNMITSRSGRSDLTEVLMTENNRGSKNSISLGSGSSKSDKDYADQLLQLMIRSQLFNSSIEGIISGSSGYFGNIVGDYMKIAEIDVEKVTGKEAWFNKIYADYIDADYIVASLLKADKIISEEIHSGSGSFTGVLSGVKIVANDVVAGTLSVDRLVFRGSEKSIVYELNNITGALQSQNVDTLNGEVLTPRTITADRIIAESITANEINVHDLWVTGIAHMFELHSDTAVIDNLTSLTSKIGNWWIEHDAITGNKSSVITGGYLRSANYKTDTLGNTTSGCLIDLNDFQIDSPDFKLNKNGITMKGNITLLPGSKVPGSAVSFGDKSLEEAFEETNQKVEDNIQYKLEVFSSAGLTFTNSMINTILSVVLYHGNHDVTEEYDDSHFIWHRISDDPDYDAYWDSQHGPAKQLRITSEDVHRQTSFRCDFVQGDNIQATSTFN